jgi:hypothetical protein
MSVNTRQLADVPGRTGFGSTLFDLPLNAGWNKLMLTLYNDENVNWRWCGLSLAFEAVEARNLRFAAQPEPNLASESGSVHAF